MPTIRFMLLLCFLILSLSSTYTQQRLLEHVCIPGEQGQLVDIYKGSL